MVMCRWIVGLVMMLAVQGVATDATSAPTAVYLKGLESQVQSVITQRDPQKAVEMFSAKFGMSVFAQRCLVDYWDGLSVEQRQQYAALFAAVLQENMKDRFKRLSSNQYAYRQRLKGTRHNPDGTWTIASDFKSPDYSGIVEYIFMESKGPPQLVDYIVDGVSLSRNYRGHFNHVMRNTGFAGLMSDLNQKLTSLRNGPS